MPDDVDVLASPGAVGANVVNQYIVNGPAFAGRAFAGDAFETADNAQAASLMASQEAFRLELNVGLDRLGAAVNAIAWDIAPRNHNGPPELIEGDLVTTADLDTAVSAALVLRAEAAKVRPNKAELTAQASIVSRIVAKIARAMKFFAKVIAGGASYDAAKWACNHPPRGYMIQ